MKSDESLKHEEGIQRVKVPSGQRLTSRPVASLARKRVTQPRSVDSELASRVIEPRKHHGCIGRRCSL